MTLSSLNAYGKAFQIKVISSLLTHKKFLVNIFDVLIEDYFDSDASKWVIKQIVSYYEKYHTTPTMDVLKVELNKLENDVLKLAVKELLREAYKASDEDLEFVQEEFSKFCQNQQLKAALLESVDLLKTGDYESIQFRIKKAMEAGGDKNVGHEYNIDVESRYREDNRTVVPTPWPVFNDLLQGGLGNGDFGLIFGNPGGGKSWLLVALGAYAVKAGYNVLHYTLELGEGYVGKRYDASLTGINVSEINSKENIAKVTEEVNQLPGKLIIKEYSPGIATIDTVRAHIEKVKNLGTEPDLIIIDYADLMGSRKKSKERKDSIDDIYLNTKGLARELNLPIWSVSQVNRAGAKDDIIEGDKAAGSYDKIMITDFALSLSRKREDKVNGTGRFHLIKNRYGMDGMTYGVKADTNVGRFEVFDYDEDQFLTPQTQPSSNGDMNSFDRKILANEFFKLNTNGNIPT